MSWDSKALAIIAVVWMAFGVIYDIFIGMPAGARAWMSGGVILLALLVVLWRTERRPATVARAAFDTNRAAVVGGEAD